ncbi:MAG: ABC-type sugar transport system, ATPase component [Microbacterium sp.]|nr:ABC-type sugar transport system, ATPase component [Microbacterium sp.]
MTEPILRMAGISKSFNGVPALADVSVDVHRGEVHAICGENGAGKSTLMKVLSGVYPAGSFEGGITLEGKEMAFRSINDSEAAGIVIIHQELALSPYLSIAENIFLGNEKARRGVIDWNATNTAAAELLKRVGLRESPATKIYEIGVGHLLDLIDQLRDQGITCIIISHKLKEVLRIADRITIIRDGRTIETMRRDDPETDEGRIIRAMVGRDLNSLFPPREPDIGDELFRVENWTVHHPVDTERVVIDNASFMVRAGEIVGFAGLMGAGRTELAMSIFGRMYGTGISGEVYKSGQQIDVRTVDAAIKHGIAYATEDRKKYGLNLIGDIQVNVSASALSRLARLGVVDRYREYKVADSYRYKMNIKAPSVAAITGRLSGGNQQKVVLSKWMFTGPDVLILDEPTRGIDVGAKYEIYGIINELAAQGKAVIVISSELPEVIGLSDRIYTISEGRITGEVSRADATQETLMRHMTAGRN